MAVFFILSSIIIIPIACKYNMYNVYVVFEWHKGFKTPFSQMIKYSIGEIVMEITKQY